MKEYPCELCKKVFDRKSNYITHINRKIPCVEKTPPNAPPLLPFPPQNQDNIKNDNDDEYICEFCKKCFSKKYNLERHLKNVCNKNANIENTDKLKELEDKFIEFKKNMEIKMNEQIMKLKNDNEKLKKDNEKIKKQIKIKRTKNVPIKEILSSKPNTNINIVNNITNNHNSNNTTNTNTNSNIVNFNNMDYSNIDKKLFINPLLNMKLYGKEIILKMIENIYINESYPEYQNIIITDKNRGYVKVYNNGKWKTNDINIINLVLDGII